MAVHFIGKAERLADHFDTNLPIIANVEFVEPLFNYIIEVVLELRSERIDSVFVRKHCVF